MEFTTLKQAKELTGLSYIGKINNGTKHEKAYKYGELVYTIYLSPANNSGYEVCPGRTPECSKLCLSNSGLNRFYLHDKITESRIKKTKLFFEHRQFFMDWVISEIKTGINRAKKMNFKFSVRINNTSDISPELFYSERDHKNILELFPEIQFYDYTKVFNRTKLLNKYSNYDLTFSYNGNNMEQSLSYLKSGYRVAMVFEKVPESFNGFKVINGDLYDMRYKDEKGVIVGLKFKKVRNNIEPDNHFVIREKEILQIV